MLVTAIVISEIVPGKRTPLDVNSLTSPGQVMAIEALAAFLAAHGSYSLLTGKTAPSEIPNA
jgi:uncharacterized membrane protein